MAVWVQGLLWLLAGLGVLFLERELRGLCRRRRMGREHTPSVSLLVLVRNCEDHLEFLVGRLAMLLSGLPSTVDGEAVMVDDDSSDRTPALLSVLARRYPGIKFACWRPSSGKGNTALELGVFLCSRPVVAMVSCTDGDSGGAALRALSTLLVQDPSGGHLWQGGSF